MSDEQVITVNATIMDGTVVRWYRGVGDAERMQPTLSASREGVRVHGEYLTAIPPAWVEDATRAHQTLAADRDADMTSWATHRNRGPSNGPLEPIQKGAD